MKGQAETILFWMAILLNALGVLIGASVYAGQFALHPAYLAIFVPDCPLYVFLALLIIFGIIRNDIFAFIVSVGMVKYGLWTVFILLFHSSYYFAPGLLPVSIVFIFGHIGMAAEGLAIMPKGKITLAALALAICWFLLNDYSDYWLGTMPLIPPGGLATLRDLTIASSILLPLALFALAGRIRENALVAWLRGILMRAA
ncbi:MAG: DUF1405 domain-containing protein [Candidatus Micrarchaeota archaeon]|nr:DUF1405 domain-containing protein [Candidatus Micrarchaeota archaeon]